MRCLKVLIGLAILLCVAPNVACLDRPVIGILALTCSDDEVSEGVCKYKFPAGYVKFLESGGSRVVPLFPNMTVEETDSTLSQLNGVLFTGGGVPIDFSDPDPWVTAARQIYDWVLDANENGSSAFPLIGICLGHEMLAAAAAGTSDIVTACPLHDATLPIEFAGPALSTKLFGEGAATPALFASIVSERPVLFHYHHNGVTPEGFAAHLDGAYALLGTNVDEDGQAFVSAFEHRAHPIFGVQFHPEKNAWEWTTAETYSHTREAVFATSQFAQSFTYFARKNLNEFPEDSGLAERLIYAFTPTYTGRDGQTWEQMYYFF
eukprot:gnl/Chilomastix_cuspidata/1523.p2 GENE.gnl/Chilomastix_cuspidata/1523~~gnl/Chilomastix_cuspidata/1523.p2  ORF type:complete len:320 (+),score=118.04 gnl/Chilomastix_cuspidata/1523:164-1123(+)